MRNEWLPTRALGETFPDNVVRMNLHFCCFPNDTFHMPRILMSLKCMQVAQVNAMLHLAQFIWLVRWDMLMILFIAVNVASFTLDKLGIPLRPGSKSTISTLNLPIQTNQLWQSMALTGVTASSLMAKKPRHVECIITEMMEIELHPDNMNRQEGFSLSRPWKPLIQTLNDCRNALSRQK
jgi:hypothetical protein